MKKIQNFLLVVLFVFAGIHIQAQEVPKASENVNSYLIKFSDDYVHAMLDGDPEPLAIYLDENVRLMPEYQKTIIGKGNAVKYQRAFLRRFDILEYKREKLETLDIGFRIIEFGVFTMKVKLKENAEEYVIQGNYGNIWKMQNNGNPLLITEAWNYSKQVECAQYLVFDDVPVVDVALEAHVPVDDNISFELAAINKLTEEFITQHDDYLWSQLYANGSKLVYSNSPIYSGKEQINAFLKEHVKYLPVFEKLDIRTDQIDNFGDYVIEYASHIAIVKNGSWSDVNTGKNFVIWQRQADCSLKIFRSMAMYD